MPSFNSSSYNQALNQKFETYTQALSQTIDITHQGMQGQKYWTGSHTNQPWSCPNDCTQTHQYGTGYGTVYVDNVKDDKYAELIPRLPLWVHCPECGDGLTVATLNTKLTCRFCEEEYIGDFRMEAVNISGRVMFFSVIQGNCPCCGKSNQRRPGRTVKCGRCKNKFRIDLPKMDAGTRRIVNEPQPTIKINPDIMEELRRQWEESQQPHQWIRYDPPTGTGTWSDSSTTTDIKFQNYP